MAEVVPRCPRCYSVLFCYKEISEIKALTCPTCGYEYILEGDANDGDDDNRYADIDAVKEAFTNFIRVLNKEKRLYNIGRLTVDSKWNRGKNHPVKVLPFIKA